MDQIEKKILAAYQASSRSAIIPPGFCRKIEEVLVIMQHDA